MPPAIGYRPFTGPTETAAVARLLHLAFAGPLDKCEQWMQDAGHEHLRVSRAPGSAESAPPSACLLRIPMGQYFGGKRVPMVGIAGVAVAPEARGDGVALSMMQACLREVRSEGAPLSCLYASTQSLYRQVGFEQAGHRFLHSVEISRIGIRDRSLPVRPLNDADEAAVRACYQRFAATTDGMLDRSPYLWRRTRAHRDDTYKGFGVFDGPELTGYLFLSQHRDPASGRHDLSISDLAFSSAAAGRRILGFLGDFGSMAIRFELFGGPIHPVLHLLPQQFFESRRKDWWMLRITDAPAAIAARGFPRSIDASVSVEVTDDLFPENKGAWHLSVRGGRGVLERSARAARGAQMDIRALACLYSGFLTPAQCAMLGTLRADPDSLDALNAVFPGGTPSMTDMF